MTSGIATGNSTSNDDEVRDSLVDRIIYPPVDNSYAFYDDNSFVVTPDMKLAAREMDLEDTDEWNQARQAAAAALQRQLSDAVDERERESQPSVPA
jgi:hypothetical protein